LELSIFSIAFLETGLPVVRKDSYYKSGSRVAVDGFVFFIRAIVALNMV
jgi:hypothetical protein